ncbi:PilZ domain-containing protein [Anderseniella sp. Alg231-50]|uniref:PilZ domain-containing protein n=1 Tax=Anderseniella sp. Alg231-50 TaxID=1922226 RepID=UPI00307B4FD4
MPDAPQQSASPVLSQSELAILQTALATLDDERLLMVLVQLPAYQLVRALECLLKPVGAASCVPQSESTDNRAADRAKVFRAAKIIYNNKMSVSECSIRDLSDSGCRVVAESLAGIPDHFTLHVLTGDTRYECEVAWRKYNMMGLRFIG